MSQEFVGSAYWYLKNQGSPLEERVLSKEKIIGGLKSSEMFFGSVSWKSNDLMSEGYNLIEVDFKSLPKEELMLVVVANRDGEMKLNSEGNPEYYKVY